MRRLFLFITLITVAAGPAGQEVGLGPHPGSPADAAARTLVAQDLAEAQRAGEQPLLLTATAALGRPHDPSILFVQLQSPRECGSAGCSTSAFQPVKNGWRKVLDAVSGPIRVADSGHNGMRDLLAGGTRYAWTGTAYADTTPAPNMSLRRRR